MSATPKKLSDIARENNVAKANRFSDSMIPSPPPKPVVNEEPKPIPAATESAEIDQPLSELTQSAPSPAPVVNETSQPQKVAKAKRGGSILNIDELIIPQPPKDESYPKQVRISAKHHRLLRELSFKKDVTINHVLFNLLDQLYEANQRDNQQHA